MLLAALPMKAQQVMEDNFQQLKVHYRTPDMQMNIVEVDGNDYYRLTIDGFVAGGEIGTPELPQLNSMIVIPFCKGMEAVVENAVYDTMLIPYGFGIMPVQPSRSKSDTTHRPVVINEGVYSTDAYIGQPLAQVERIGIARDRNLATLTFSPVQVNPMTNMVVVCRSADITVRYIGADEQATLDVFQRYYTPVFSAGPTLNTLLSPKYVSNATPIRMAVLAHSSLRCQALDQFFDWKRSQGLRVDVFYIDEIGYTAPSAIDAMLKGLYANATAADPAPAFLLVVGDVAQVPSHNSKLQSSGWYGPSNDHITDLYYTTWSDDDVVSDCYFGRFSAIDTVTLGYIAEKTMYYEQYAFEDDSYLARAALIAGIDQPYVGDNAYTYADPAMDYIAKYYINHLHGYDTVLYFKNAVNIHADPNIVVTGSSNSSNTATILKDYYNEGAGWINYSAHGDWDSWYKPSLRVRDVNAMSNVGMPSFVIGSCCLTNKFEKSVCLGEAFLRRGDNAGAIGYIGGTNSTYWSEDFYWAVGVRSSISGNMNATYDVSHMGVYDRLFHTHGEDFANSIASAGQLVLYGNMAVQNSSSTLKDYYWEIYQLMGDPSLMPWLGRAEDPYADHIAVDANTVQLHTMPNAYVAIVNPSDSNRVIAADFANINGDITLNVSSHEGCLLAITAQNYKPLSISIDALGVNQVQTPQFNVSLQPNPASGRVTIDALPDGAQVQLYDMTGHQLPIDNWYAGTLASGKRQQTIDISNLAPSIYLLQVSTPRGTVTEKLIVQ